MIWLFKSDKEDPISNFLPNVVALVNMHESNATDHTTCVKIYLLFEENEKSEEFTILLTKLEDFDWLTVDARCRLNPDFSRPKAQRYLADHIRAAIPAAPVEECYQISTLGSHILGGKPMFFTGVGLIRPPSEKKISMIKFDKLPYNLDFDINIPEEKAAADMLELISLSPSAGKIILTHSLMYVMRKAYEDAWKPPRCCVFLHGKTGSYKTTFSQFLTQLYNRSAGIQNPPRLNSSIPAAVSLIYEKSDCVIVLDDLFPAVEKKLRMEQEKTLFEIIRIIGDGIRPGRVKSNQVATTPPTCGVLFTGEYLIGTGSDAARILPVKMEIPDREKLKKFQSDPLLVSTFYNYFIKWFVENYYPIRDYLKEWHDTYSKLDLGVHPRLQETHYFFKTSFLILIQYYYDNDYITGEQADRLHYSFLSLLDNLINAQQRLVEQCGSEAHKNVDYLAKIRTLYKSEVFNLTENPKDFTSLHDGFIHNGYLCLYGKRFKDGICRDLLEDDYNHVLKSLESQGALKTGKDRKTIQVSATGGKRFYAIPIEKLK